MFGEDRVLTFFEGEFQRFAWLGTEEADAALKEFELKARSKRRKKVREDFGATILGCLIFQCLTARQVSS